METEGRGKRIVNRIVVTSNDGMQIWVCIDKIVVFYSDGLETTINAGITEFVVKESPEEIDALIDKAMGAK